MRKLIPAVLLGIAVMLLASCSPPNLGGVNNAATNLQAGSGSVEEKDTTASPDESKAADMPASPDESKAADMPASPAGTPAGTPDDTSAGPDTAASADTAGQSTAVTAAEPVDTGITLEMVKKAAQDAGYPAEDIKEDLRQDPGPSPVRGIYLNYKDETLQSQSPVYEFKSSAEALEYAGKVNMEGYSLCIVNGKLVTMTGSKYGVVLNDKQKATLEKLLQSSVMAYEEPAPPQASSNKDYAGACTRVNAIVQAIDKLVNKPVIIYQKSLPAEDPGKNIASISFSIFSSPDMAFTLALCEDQPQMDLVVKTWEMYGCTDVKLKHDAANDYTLTGKRAGMDDPFSIHCVYSPDKDSLRISDINGGEKVELLEFVPLGADKYAFQTLYERGIVGYRDGKITSLIYSVRKREKESAYDPEADSIYPDGKGVNDSWVSKLGEDNYEQFITFDGAKLKISAVDFMGTRIKIEIGV